MDNVRYIDIHSHLHDKAYDSDRDAVIEEMKKCGVSTITVGTDYEESVKAVALATLQPRVYATVGMHPVDNRTEVFGYEKYKTLAIHEKVVAIGECGLDYFRSKEELEKGIIASIEEEKETQKKLFLAQVELAIECDLPLMIHGRPSTGTMDAYNDLCDLLEEEKKKHGKKLRGNFHFFVGNVAVARRIVNLDFTMSFSGVITFAKEYEEVVRYIPLSHIHAETDSPYASPIPYRGKRNSPMYVEKVIEHVATLRNESKEEVASILKDNAGRLFFS